MMCSHLVNLGVSDRHSSVAASLRKHLGAAPTLENIQLGIEKVGSIVRFDSLQAWEMGFDSLGGSQLGFKLHNTEKWGIPAVLMNYHDLVI